MPSDCIVYWFAEQNRAVCCALLCSCKQAKLPEVMAVPAARTVKTKEEKKQEKAAAAAAAAAAEKAKAAKPT
jgi:hypothetical protein